MAGPTDATRSERRRARPQLLAELEAQGSLPCPRCGQPMYPWQDLDVGHPLDVADVGPIPQPLRLEHRHCNRAAGDRRRPPPAQPAPPDIGSREW